MPEDICESATQPGANSAAPVDAAAIVEAVNTANDRFGASVIFNLLLDERDVSGRSLEHIKRALGDGADELIPQLPGSTGRFDQQDEGAGESRARCGRRTAECDA